MGQTPNKALPRRSFDLFRFANRRDENFKSTKRPARSGVDDRGSLVVPTTPVQACTQAVVCRIPAACESVYDHLPDAVFNAAESVLNLGDPFRTVQEREGRLIA